MYYVHIYNIYIDYLIPFLKTIRFFGRFFLRLPCKNPGGHFFLILHQESSWIINVNQWITIGYPLVNQQSANWKMAHRNS